MFWLIDDSFHFSLIARTRIPVVPGFGFATIATIPADTISATVGQILRLWW